MDPEIIAGTITIIGLIVKGLFDNHRTKNLLKDNSSKIMDLGNQVDMRIDNLEKHTTGRITRLEDRQDKNEDRVSDLNKRVAKISAKLDID